MIELIECYAESIIGLSLWSLQRRLHYRASGLIRPIPTRRSRCFYPFICLNLFFCVFFSAVIFIFRWMNSSILLIIVCLYDLYSLLRMICLESDLNPLFGFWFFSFQLISVVDCSENLPYKKKGEDYHRTIYYSVPYVLL